MSRWDRQTSAAGDRTVAQRLETIGFKVLNLRRPDWTRDEIILACALAESNGWRQVYDTDPRAKELSQLLQSSAIHPLPRHPDFRNPAGVGQKTRNIVDWHPDHRGSRSNGNHLDKEVLNDFLADPIRMRAMAKRIRELLTAADPDSTELPDLDPVDLPAGYYSCCFSVCDRAAAQRGWWLEARWLHAVTSFRPSRVRWRGLAGGRRSGASGRGPGGVCAMRTSGGRRRGGRGR